MHPRRLFVETLESRVVLNAIGLGTESQGPEWEHVVVMLNERTASPEAVAERVLGPLGGRVGHVYQHALKGFSAHLPAAGVERLSAHFMVRGVESNLILHTQEQIVPTGVQRIGTLQNSRANIGGEETQIDVGIAILDTGIDITHPDLNVAGGIHYWTRYINTGPPRNRGLQSGEDFNYNDDNGHGTHVAGIAAARDNGTGVVGVAPGARLYSVKVLGASGSGNMDDIIAGVDWVTKPENAANIQVANMSLGGTGQSPALHQAIQNSVAAGIVYFVSAGNDWRDILGDDLAFPSDNNTIPAAYPEVATISAFADSDGLPGGLGEDTSWGEYGRDDAWWGPSNFSNSDDGGNSWYDGNNFVDSPGLGIDLVLPGVDIDSTHRNGGYATMSGTSMAAPHAAGLAALYIAEHGRATDADKVYAIRQALIDQGISWRDPGSGLAHWWGPDKHEENLGWAGDPVAEPEPTLTVSITEPAEGESLEGIVTIQAVAAYSDPGVPIEQVEFFVSSGDVIVVSALGTLDNDVWSVSWNTDEQDTGIPRYPDGVYTIEARATVFLVDEEDQIATDIITVTVDNVYAEPTVKIISPEKEVDVSGTVDIQATAFADPRLQVASVEFLIHGNRLDYGVLNSETGIWSVSWNTDKQDTNGPCYPDGVYTIKARATVVLADEEDQIATDTIQVTVDNTKPDTDIMSASLDGSVHEVNRNMWEAIALVTVTADGPLVGATVSGQWEGQAIVTATTGDDGIATFASGNLRYNRVDAIKFTLVDVVLDGYEYESGVQQIEFFSNEEVKLLSLEDELLSPADPDAYLSAVDQLMATAW